MIIEHDGICYDTNNPEQNAQLTRIYKGMYEDMARKETNLITHFANVNQMLRSDRSEVVTIDTTITSEELHGQSLFSAVGAPLIAVSLLFFVIFMFSYILGWWSFDICIQATNGLQLCL